MLVRGVTSDEGRDSGTRKGNIAPEKPKPNPRERGLQGLSNACSLSPRLDGWAPSGLVREARRILRFASEPLGSRRAQVKLSNPTRGLRRVTLSIALFGGSAIALEGCDGGQEVAETNATAGTGESGGESDGADTGGAEAGTGDGEAGESADANDTAADDGNESGGNFTGLGCQAPPSCDGGTLSEWTRLATEADMQAVMGVTAIGSNLEIAESEFECLDFLACLETIDGDLTIFGNENLKSIAGLEAVSTISGNVSISSNAFETLAGFSALREVQQLRISRNDQLTSISGFSDLSVIQTTLSIQDNPVLDDISGLNGLKAVGETFVVTQNPSLCISKVNAVGAGLQQCGDADDDGQCDGSTSGNKTDC